MAKVKIQGHASGTGVLTVTAPNTSTDRTITLPDESVTLGAATPSIDDNGDATAITINSSEDVLINTTQEFNTLNGRGNLVVGSGSGNEGITIYTGTSNTGGLTFADGTSGSQAYEGQISYEHSDNSMRFAVNGGAERMRILSSGGLTFNGDTAAANALNDYEEGSCTMRFRAEGNSTVAGSSSASYTKIGRQVTVRGDLSGNISGLNQSSNMEISGLPFATDGVGTVPFFTRNLEAPSDSNVIGYYTGSVIQIWFMPNHANYVQADVQDFHGTTNDCYFTATYFTT